MTPAAIDVPTIGIMAALGLLASMVLFVAFVGFVDALLMKKWGVDATISRGMERIGYMWPAIPFAIGLVIGVTVGLMAGHWWMVQPPLPH